MICGLSLRFVVRFLEDPTMVRVVSASPDSCRCLCCLFSPPPPLSCLCSSCRDTDTVTIQEYFASSNTSAKTMRNIYRAYTSKWGVMSGNLPAEMSGLRDAVERRELAK